MRDHEVEFTVAYITNLSLEIIIAARKAKEKHHY